MTTAVPNVVTDIAPLFGAGPFFAHDGIIAHLGAKVNLEKEVNVEQDGGVLNRLEAEPVDKKPIRDAEWVIALMWFLLS
jgi:hypothetical protein